MKKRFYEHAFFTHDWGLDEHERRNHDRVREVADVCKRNGLKIWFDEDKMAGNVLDKMCDGIDGSATVVVFVTKNYIEKVAQSERSDDNCKLEFNYAMRRRKPNMMIAVVMEASCRDTNDWRGAVGMALGNHLYIDMADGDLPDHSRIQTLVQTIKDTINKYDDGISFDDLKLELEKISEVGSVHQITIGTIQLEGKITQGTSQKGSGEFKFNSFRYKGEFEGSVPDGKGVYEDNFNNVYTGDFRNGRKHGKGVLDEGRVTYTGDFVNDVKHGNGVEEYLNGDRYEGEFKEGKKQGTGTMVHANGNVESGKWDDDRFLGDESVADLHSIFFGTAEYKGKILAGNREHGLGEFLRMEGSNAGNTYLGIFSDTVPDGFGKFSFGSSGDVYEGTYERGKKNGYGTYTFSKTGALYQGDYLDGKKNGYGVYTAGSGDVYTGEYVQGERQGLGTKTMKDGTQEQGVWEADKYVGPGSDVGRSHTIKFGEVDYEGKILYGSVEHGFGEFIRDRDDKKNRYVGTFTGSTPEGFGTFYFASGEVYEGRYLGGKKNGHGTYTFKSGAKYVGNYKDGQKHGYGVYKSASGDTYEGEYKEGKKHGLGTQTFKDGTVQSGRFVDDKLVA